MTPALEAIDLHRFYRTETDEVVALRGVSLEVEPGEIVAIVGPSGSGKSTLLSCLAGLEDPDGGVVKVAGQRISHRPNRHRARLRARSIGMVFQQRNLFEHLTVAQNVIIACRMADVRASHEDVRQTLARLGIGERGPAYPSELSGGESARAAIAVAIQKKPSVVLADEPTAEVGAGMEAATLELFEQMRADGTASVLVTHSPSVAAIADRVFHLVDGELHDD